jgi:hypothetical protein
MFLDYWIKSLLLFGEFAERHPQPSNSATIIVSDCLIERFMLSCWIPRGCSGDKRYFHLLN